MSNEVYIAAYTFPGEGFSLHLGIFNNAEAAIECVKKARNNGSNWTLTDKREVQSKIDKYDGMPDTELPKE